MAVIHRQPLGDTEILIVDADPSGATSALVGAVAYMDDGTASYRNIDGATAWSRQDVRGLAVGIKVSGGSQGPFVFAGGTTLDVTADPGFDFTTTPGVAGHEDVEGIPVMLEVAVDGQRGCWNTVAGRPTPETYDDDVAYAGMIIAAATLSIVQGDLAPTLPTGAFCVITTPARDTTGPYTLRFLQGSFEDDPIPTLALTGVHLVFQPQLSSLEHEPRDFELGCCFGLARLARPVAVAGGNAGLMTGADKTKIDAIPDAYSASVAGSSNADTTSATHVLVTGMTITPGAGDYLVWFTVTGNVTAALETLETAIYANSVVVADSECPRKISNIGDIGSIGTHCRVTGLSAGQAIEGRFRSVGGNNVRITKRNLSVLRIG